MEEFVKRIVKEKEELDIKLTNLESFIGSEKYKELDVDMIILLLKQRRAMGDYTAILKERIEYYKKNN